MRKIVKTKRPGRNPIIEQDLKNITAAKLPWQKFYGKTVLITGASGMLAAYLVETLLYLNEYQAKPKIKVVALVKNKARALKRFAYYAKRKDLKLVVADISRPLSISGKVDYIIHAASYASPKIFSLKPVDTLLPNVLGSHQVLELARRKKSQGVLFFSSGEVYGEPNTKIIGENDYGYLDPTKVRACYGESKRLGENMCASYHFQYGVPIKIVRPFHTYGPGMKLDDGRIFADFVSNVVKGEDIVLHSKGEAIRVFCYISDATKGFFTVLLKGESGQAYNVANRKQHVSIISLAKIMVGLFPEKNLHVIMKPNKKPLGYLKSPVKATFPSIAKVKALGWEPKISIREGFKRTINSYLF